MSYKRNVVEYIKKNLAKGYTLDSLRFALVNQGYSRAIVDTAIKQANIELAKKAPILKEKPVIKHEIIDENDKPIKIKRPWWKRGF